MREANEQTPPVVDQGHRTRRQLAAVQIMGGKATPAPLIFQFIEGIFGIRSIPVELAQAENLEVRVGDQHGVLVTRNFLAGFFVRLNESQD